MTNAAKKAPRLKVANTLAAHLAKLTDAERQQGLEAVILSFRKKVEDLAASKTVSSPEAEAKKVRFSTLYSSEKIHEVATNLFNTWIRDNGGDRPFPSLVYAIVRKFDPKITDYASLEKRVRLQILASTTGKTDSGDVVPVLYESNVGIRGGHTRIADKGAAPIPSKAKKVKA